MQFFSVSFMNQPALPFFLHDLFLKIKGRRIG